jgi:hypothetical protein
MKFYFFVAFITLTQIAWAEDDEAEISASPQQASVPAASAIPAMTPEQAKMLLEKVQQGHKLKDEQKKALEELDEEE